MAWFKREIKPLIETNEELTRLHKENWVKCEKCGEGIPEKQVVQDAFTCKFCGNSFRINSEIYLSILLDKGGFKEFDAKMQSVDPLNSSIQKRIPGASKNMIEKSGLYDAIRTGLGKLTAVLYRSRSWISSSSAEAWDQLSVRKSAVPWTGRSETNARSSSFPRAAEQG